jgi:PiT family inorganic phosphate transporter
MRLRRAGWNRVGGARVQRSAAKMSNSVGYCAASHDRMHRYPNDSERCAVPLWLLMLYLLIGLAIVYSFLNGYRDSSCILAGVIASRAMRPRVALYLVAAAELIAPFFFGSAVTRSITSGLVNTAAVSLNTVVIAMSAAVAWNVFCWWRGIPSSSTHALIGGLLGAALILDGPHSILTRGVVLNVLPLILAPIIGFILAFLLMSAMLWSLNTATPRINDLLRKLQVLTAVLLGMSNSANDAHKSMGIILLGMVLAGQVTSFQIPIWVMAVCAGALATGASLGDWRQIRNLGGKVYRIRPVNALASQITSSAIVLAASAFGMPVSTSHIVTTALMGSGASERVNKVRWNVAGEMVTTWVVTIPATMAVSMLILLAITEFDRLGVGVILFMQSLGR